MNNTINIKTKGLSNSNKFYFSVVKNNCDQEQIKPNKNIELNEKSTDINDNINVYSNIGGTRPIIFIILIKFSYKYLIPVMDKI